MLEQLIFEAKPGEVVAQTGPGGSGKTTTVNLLLKFYRPQSRAIYMDGVDIQEIGTAWLR